MIEEEKDAVAESEVAESEVAESEVAESEVGAEEVVEAEVVEEPEAPEESELEQAQRERGEFLALAQRNQADLENFRKRAAKEAAAAGVRAKSGLVGELLPVVDNLERALHSAPDDDPMAGGVKLVHSELVGVLARNGVEQFDPRGEKFDPSFHEALSTRPAEDAEPGVVLDTVEKGYRLNGNVIRPARVVVSG